MPQTVTVESHGVTFDVDLERLADQRFVYCLTRVQDETVGDAQRLVFYGRMLATLFGDDGAYELMCQLAEQAGGTTSAELFNEFFGDVLEQARAKNS